MAAEALAGGAPAGMVEAAVSVEARRRHPRHGQAVVGVVVGEERLASEEEQALVPARPGLERLLVPRPSPPVDGIHVGEAADDGLASLGGGEALEAEGPGDGGAQ